MPQPLCQKRCKATAPGSAISLATGKAPEP